MDALIEMAQAAGYKVEWVSMSRYTGLLLDDRILINQHRSIMTQRVALAHELGHIHHGHDWRVNPHSRERDERQANRFAAELLVDPVELMEAEMLYESPGAVAAALSLPESILDIWRASAKA
ncbi:ImmA/IrrE family metallo-endopeptidase [Jonesia denitrificans]|uniref:IrrE N-terminal-like domain-containing protein n=1 Tax=Jonesia denitrificans (strain ATCC 14870 / DSM 20603 / BCRC 15368 / CIP 55.134 / JCM 11481 / NBRC 15587 / NCTC 10816 / Prevot 55134) TaxID=471856 RepID=C7R217_JONDD|nr:ImmA/IrrE family metallo-endopeptidase [Jonesia denitrificans]ACV09905.1 protein of unknown function DUF955 [Jonesia denitrificans DSM 20603]QXB43456.1 ImmA/IrrE family metallo-endopeptidase [Jonesia denitrificans]SQH22623.1 Domain of uncharacterised function (DUF955) [Jonesia denitrificans]